MVEARYHLMPFVKTLFSARIVWNLQWEFPWKRVAVDLRGIVACDEHITLKTDEMCSECICIADQDRIWLIHSESGKVNSHAPRTHVASVRVPFDRYVRRSTRIVCICIVLYHRLYEMTQTDGQDVHETLDRLIREVIALSINIIDGIRYS
jgi:hypothetical protein